MDTTKKQAVVIKAKCTGCGMITELSEQQLADAKQDGAAISYCCFMPMTVVSAKVSGSNKAQKGRP